MATQGNLFGGVGAPIGSSIFDPISAATNTGAMSPAQRSAMTFMQNGPPRQFGLPSHGPGPRRQMAFDFSRSSAASTGRTASLGSKFGKGALRGLRAVTTVPSLALEAGVGVGIVAAGAVQGAAQWGAPTGLEEDYIGGAVYGGTKGAGTAVGGFTGMLAGTAIGAGIGSIIPGAGTVAGGLIGGAIGIGGSIAGALAGEAIGGALINSPARTLGLGARAIARTARAVDRVQFGGSFVDSQGAYTMRQRAVSDMSGSMMNARQFLGNEAIFLHER